MNAKQFGLLLRQKIAASTPDNVVPPNSPATRDPDWQAIQTNLANANLPPAAWQHAGLPAMTAEQLNNASARDIWYISQQIAKAPRATYRRGSDPRQVNAFNAVRGKSIGLGKRYSPVFAGEGKPGYKPPLASIGLAQPQQPQQQQQPPRPPAPAAVPAQGGPPAGPPRRPPAPAPPANAANPNNPSIINDLGQRVPVANENLAKGAVPRTQLLPPIPRR